MKPINEQPEPVPDCPLCGHPARIEPIAANSMQACCTKCGLYFTPGLARDAARAAVHGERSELARALARQHPTLSYAQLGRKCGLSKQGVINALKRGGVAKPRRAREPTERHEVRLSADEWSAVCALALQLGCTPGAWMRAALVRELRAAPQRPHKPPGR